MFYSAQILSKKGPLGTIWIAAHLDRKLRRNQVFETNISSSVESILNPEAPLALRLSGQLLLGVVRIYSRKVIYLFQDCNDALVKIKQAFNTAVVDLPPDAARAQFSAITLPEDYEDLEIYAGHFKELAPSVGGVRGKSEFHVSLKHDYSFQREEDMFDMHMEEDECFEVPEGDFDQLEYAEDIEVEKLRKAATPMSDADPITYQEEYSMPPPADEDYPQSAYGDDYEKGGRLTASGFGTPQFAPPSTGGKSLDDLLGLSAPGEAREAHDAGAQKQKSRQVRRKKLKIDLDKDGEPLQPKQLLVPRQEVHELLEDRSSIMREPTENSAEALSRRLRQASLGRNLLDYYRIECADTTMASELREVYKRALTKELDEKDTAEFPLHEDHDAEADQVVPHDEEEPIPYQEDEYPMYEQDMDVAPSAEEVYVAELDTALQNGEEDSHAEGWSVRTKNVAMYLQAVFKGEEESQAPESLSLDDMLHGKGRKEAARMFFEMLVLKTKDFIQLDQPQPYANIQIKPQDNLFAVA